VSASELTFPFGKYTNISLRFSLSIKWWVKSASILWYASLRKVTATSRMFATEMSDSNSRIVTVDHLTHSSLLSKTMEVLMILVALM